MTKQLFWKFAIIEEVLQGRDGKVRAVKVKVPSPGEVPSPGGSPTVLRQSVQHLIPLEISHL